MSSLQQTKKRISPDEAHALWHEYKTTGDVKVRNRLVMTFAPLVKYIVFKKVRELPARCEVEDFISCGLEALIVSVDDLRRREDDIAVSDVTSLNTLVISDDETTVERIDTLAAGDDRLDPEHASANE